MWPEFEADEIAAVGRVLESGRVNYWTGEEGRAFEAECAARFGARYGVALANGTLALDLALRVSGITAGDEVIVTPRSFVASVSTVALCGARPVFADVDRESQNVTERTIEPLITSRTRAILPVHLGGWPCDMPAIMDLAEANGLVVIEDCAQAHGAEFRGAPVGSFGHLAAFSFCQDKIMTTAGEGGLLITDDAGLFDKAASFKDHGKNLSKLGSPSANGAFRYIHDQLGSNYRMTEVQAAVGRVQLGKLAHWLATRRNNAAYWNEALADLAGIRLTIPPDHIAHAYYKYYAFIEPEAFKSGWDRDRLLQELRNAGVICFSGSCPEIYLEKAFANVPGAQSADRLPAARELGNTSLMFLSDPTISTDQIAGWANTVRRLVSAAVR